MTSAFSHVGIANLFEEKKVIIDGKKEIYYEKLEPCFGFIHDFAKGRGFVVLSGKLAGKILTDNSDVLYSDFKTLANHVINNDNIYDYDKFLKKYKTSVGKYFTYNSKEKHIFEITDQELLKKIQSTNKDYDDAILNKDSDISQMYSEIKKTIISQDEQIMQILTTLFKNQKVVNGKFDIDMISKLKENLIIYGSTGTGKTEILKRIAKIYKVPIVIEDATSLTESGYVGRNIQDMLNDLYLASGKNMDLAQKGILVIDEFDKLAEKDSSRNHVSKEGVQRSLLKLLDGTEYYFDGLTFDTSRLSVVALGAFTDITKSDNYSDITTKNFVDYGIMRELMGRFSKLVAMNSLTKDDIKKILIDSNFSPINTYKCLFESMNIEFTYEDDFIDYLAEKAVALNSGARGIKTVFDDIISSAMFRIFAGDYSSIHLTRPIEHEKPYVLTKTLKK